MLQQTLATVAHIQMAGYKMCSNDTSKTMTRIKSTKEEKMSFISRIHIILAK